MRMIIRTRGFMGIISRTVFREVAVAAFLGAFLFTFVLFLYKVGAKLFEILVRSSAPPKTVAYLFSLALPPTLTFAIPLGVLVGILIGLSRMSSDGEITAMRAAGVPSRRVVAPILTFGFLATLIAAACSLFVTPWSVRETYRVLNQLAAAQLTAEIQARVFEEQFPNTILWVGDVVPGPITHWKNVFLADITPPEDRPKSAQERGDSPRVTMASDAIATPDVVHNRIQLSLLNGSNYDVGKDIAQYRLSSFPRGEQLLEAQKPGEVRATKPTSEMDIGPLYRQSYKMPELDRGKILEARIELHQRFALPLACLLLGLVGIPLGVSSRKGGKSTAFVLTVALAFLYYMGMISLIGLAKQGTIPVPLAVWLPNAVFAIAGLIMMIRLEVPGDRDWVALVRDWLVSFFRSVRGSLPSAPGVGARRFPLLPQVIDTYVLTSFLFYFVLLLVSFVIMIQAFTFFELLSDIVKNRIPMPRVLTYLVFLTPKLIYDMTPISVLVAVLITFGILSKHNEVTALKACGVSLYRLSVPVLAAAVVLSAGLFAFDHYYVPEANRKQDAIRNEIKGRPVQTYLRPDRKWIVGSGKSMRIYYYKYFDPVADVMAGVSVYEIDTERFRLNRQVAAEKARWDAPSRMWVFYNGWSRDFDGLHDRNFQDFTGGSIPFPELNEPPNYFLKEVKQDKQMNFEELSNYIHDLQQGGFDTVRLQVQFHKKFSIPLFALIMAGIAIPFAFGTGSRGAMAGVGLSFGIAIAYLSINQLFEQVGNVSQLPAPVAAWSPDAIFSLAGLYFFVRMKT